jgi:hypothetical protein
MASSVQPANLPFKKKPRRPCIRKPGPARRKCVWCSITHGHSCSSKGPQCSVARGLGGLGSDALLERCRRLRPIFGDALRSALERNGERGVEMLELRLAQANAINQLILNPEDSDNNNNNASQKQRSVSLTESSCSASPSPSPSVGLDGDEGETVSSGLDILSLICAKL